MLTSPAFGQADLSNCERELIHLAGSVQPHGLLLVMRRAELARRCRPAANAGALLGRGRRQRCCGRPLADLGGDLDARSRSAGADLRAGASRSRCACSIDRAGTRRRLRRRHAPRRPDAGLDGRTGTAGAGARRRSR
ncbi:MAG: hypothetical protein MZW92_69820 [Comamonadaceae bacterium]|nr:hypothetical protein [Comamonadaceae bacterium]